jgi:hypothetical protein
VKTMRRTVMVLWMAAGGCDPEEIEHETGGGTDDGGDDPEATFPTRYAEAYCTALFACDPVNTCWQDVPYSSEAECVDGERTALVEASAAAKEGGLVYDDACVDEWIAHYAEIGCDGENQILHRFGERPDFEHCQPYYGTIPEGEDPCFDIVGTELSECAAGSYCSDETCERVATFGCDCAEGSTCAFTDDDAVCEPILALGETCMMDGLVRTGVCTVDTYCDYDFDQDGMLIGPAVCAESIADGSACEFDFECASSLCDGVCVPAPPFLCYPATAPRRWR